MIRYAATHRLGAHGAHGADGLHSARGENHSLCGLQGDSIAHHKGPGDELQNSVVISLCT